MQDTSKFNNYFNLSIDNQIVIIIKERMLYLGICLMYSIKY